MRRRGVEAIDGVVGRAIDRSLQGHHRRRLRRAGRLDQVEPPSDGSLWAAGDPPVREGNELAVLVDGELALGRIAEALSGARASQSVAKDVTNFRQRFSKLHFVR